MELTINPHNRKTNRVEKPAYARRSEFLTELRQRIDSCLGEKARRDDPRIYIKTIVIMMSYLATYAFLLSTAFAEVSVYLQVFALVFLAVGCAGIGFNSFHDSIHGSFSSRRRINRVVAFLSCSLIGASRLLWYQKHNVLHHQYPNVHKWDDDLETRNNLRLSPYQAWHSKFTYQHIYFPFMYALGTLEWVFFKDFHQYFSKRLSAHQKAPRFSRADHIEFWVSKLIYFSLFLVVPLMLFPVWKVVVGLVIFHITTGLILAAIFQPAHVMEEALFSAPESMSKDGKDDWASFQMKTTVNFAPKNKFLNWYAGGLNYQVEHHLFPNMTHTHYPAVSRIVKETAKEFGLPYHSHDSYFSALQSHYRILKRLSQPN